MYRVVVVTGWKGTSSNASIAFVGTHGITEASPLSFPSIPDETEDNYVCEFPERSDLFSSGKSDTFWVMAHTHIGELLSVILSHDNSGFSSSWFVDRIYVDDVEQGQSYECIRDGWVEKGDGSTSVTISAVKRERTAFEWVRSAGKHVTLMGPLLAFHGSFCPSILG